MNTNNFKSFKERLEEIRKLAEQRIAEVKAREDSKLVEELKKNENFRKLQELD
jgi:hypothetical protein